MSAEARKMILRKLQEGKINLEEADELLAAIEGKETARSAEGRSGNIFERVVGEVGSKLGAIRTGGEPKVEKILGSIGEKIGSVVATATSVIESAMESVVSGFQPEGERFELTEQVGIELGEGVRFVVVNNFKGHVTLIGEDRSDVALKILKAVWAGNEEDAEKKARSLHLNWQVVGDRLKIEMPEPGKTLFQRDVIDTVCHLPRHLVPSASTVSGNITVRDMAFTGHEADLKTVSGHITLERLSGQVSVQTVSGELTVHQADGEWQLKTVSGRIDIAEGRLAGAIKSVSGHLHLRGVLDGKLQFSSMSGDFEADMKVATGAALEVGTTSGNITLRLKPDSDAQVTGASQAGEVKCSAPLNDLEVEKHQLKGRLGSGSGQISLRSTSGAISVQ